MLNANLFIFACAGILGVKKPIEIRMSTNSKAAPGHKHKPAAYYVPRYRKDKIIRHVIFLNLEIIITSRFNISEVIAHEICHAAQFEYGIFNHKKHHDKKFQKLCKVLETECKKLGFPLKNLYNPLSDTD